MLLIRKKEKPRKGLFLFAEKNSRSIALGLASVGRREDSPYGDSQGVFAGAELRQKQILFFRFSRHPRRELREPF